MKSGVSAQKTPIWASICTPVAPGLLISSGHSPRLGGTIFVWGAQEVIWGGGTARVCPPWRRVWIEKQSFVIQSHLNCAQNCLCTCDASVSATD